MTQQPLNATERVKVLSEALPYIHKFYNRVIVIKYGGSAMTESLLKQSFARDVVLLKAVGMHPVVVHGGGPNISRNLRAVGINSQFVNGLRVTDRASLAIIKETLQQINASIHQSIAEHGGEGYSIVADGLITATQLRAAEGPSEGIDLGRVGEVSAISPDLDNVVHHPTRIPIISPLGMSAAGECFNINADWVASSIAQRLSAEKLILMTNTAGVLDEHGALIVQASSFKIADLVARKTIHGGMLPKVSCALKAVANGVAAADIIDGRTPHAVLLELLTDEGVGTLIKQY